MLPLRLHQRTKPNVAGIAEVIESWVWPISGSVVLNLLQRWTLKRWPANVLRIQKVVSTSIVVTHSRKHLWRWFPGGKFDRYLSAVIDKTGILYRDSRSDTKKGQKDVIFRLTVVLVMRRSYWIKQGLEAITPAWPDLNSFSIWPDSVRFSCEIYFIYLLGTCLSRRSGFSKWDVAKLRCLSTCEAAQLSPAQDKQG